MKHNSNKQILVHRLRTLTVDKSSALQTSSQTSTATAGAAQEPDGVTAVRVVISPPVYSGPCNQPSEL